MAHIMMTGASAAVVPRCKGSSFTVDAQSLKRVVRREEHIPRWCSGGLRASLSETHSCRGRAHQSALQAALSQPAGGNFSAAETEVTTQHVLSVFVTDEAALINHVSQIFNDAGNSPVCCMHCSLFCRLIVAHVTPLADHGGCLQEMFTRCSMLKKYLSEHCIVADG